MTTITIGDRYGQGTVTETGLRLPGTRKGQPVTTPGARLLCDCGNQYTARNNNLRSGNTTSCGCRKQAARRTHGLSSHPLWGTWHAMLYRCEDPGHHAWPHYGGRGITVCPAWHDLAAFITDIETAIGPRPAGKTLDRIDNDGNYEPGNVRWATRAEQVANARNRGRTPAERAELDRKVTELHLAGVAYAAIGEELGITRLAAYRSTRRGCTTHPHRRGPQTCTSEPEKLDLDLTA